MPINSCRLLVAFRGHLVVVMDYCEIINTTSNNATNTTTTNSRGDMEKEIATPVWPRLFLVRPSSKGRPKDAAQCIAAIRLVSGTGTTTSTCGQGKTGQDRTGQDRTGRETINKRTGKRASDRASDTTAMHLHIRTAVIHGFYRKVQSTRNQEHGRRPSAS